MQQNRRKPKSFLRNTSKVVSIIFSIQGIIFFTIGCGFLFVPDTSESLSVYHNGILQQQNVTEAQRTMLMLGLVFGVTGLALFIASIVPQINRIIKQKKWQKLKKNGEHIIVPCELDASAHITVNHQPLQFLKCSYSAPDGCTYIFKSAYLRSDPIPYLKDKQVNIYYEYDNMKNYFVDVDGSIFENTRIVEL